MARFTMAPAFWILPFINALRAAIGSDWLMTAPAVRQIAMPAMIVRRSISSHLFLQTIHVPNTILGRRLFRSADRPRPTTIRAGITNS